MTRLALALVLLATACASSPAPEWEERRLVLAAVGAADAVDCLVAAPDQPLRLYAAGNVGEPHLEAQAAAPYLVTSADGGKTWTSLQAGLDAAAVTALSASAPRGGQRSLLVGTQEAGLYLSVDSGQTWEPVSEGLPREFQPQAVGILPGGWENLLSVSSAGAVFCSGDSGQTWTQATGAEGLPSALAVDSARALLQTAAGLFGSYDLGRTWERISEHGGVPGYGSISTCAADPSVIYLVTKKDAGSWVVRSLDAGKTWERVAGTEGAQDVEVDPESSSTIYLLTSQGEASVKSSSDGGATWGALSGRLSAGELVVAGTQPRTLYAVDRMSRSLHVLSLGSASK